MNATDAPSSPHRPHAGRRPPALVFGIIAAAFLAASALMWVRGPQRAIWGGSNDFALIYGSTRAWLLGGNPYDADAVGRIWDAARGDAQRSPARQGSQDLLYPPSTFLILAPVGALDWPAAAVAWALFNTFLLVLIIACLCRIAAMPHRSAWTWAFVAAAVAFAPAHTCIALGQTSLLVVAMIAAGYALRTQRPGRTAAIVCGVLLGLASALKPQIGLVFLGWELLRCRWATTLAGGFTGAAVLLLGGVRLWLSGVDWIGAWRANMQAFAATGEGDASLANPVRFQMLNLQNPLRAIWDQPAVVGAIIIVLVVSMALAFWLLYRRAQLRGRIGLLAAASMAGVLSLLAVYHRFYDAVVLLFALALVARLFRDRRARPAVALFVPPAVFFVPGAAMLYVGAQRSLIPPWLTHTRVLWQGVILAHESWAVLALGVVLVWLVWRGRAAVGDQPDSLGVT